MEVLMQIRITQPAARSMLGRLPALLLAFALIFSGVTFPGAGGVFAADAPEPPSALEPGTYSLPLTFGISNGLTWEPNGDGTNVGSTMQVYDRALLTVTTTGVAIRMQYYSQSLFQPANNGFIQVLDPAQLDDAKEVSTRNFQGFPAGDFSYSEALKAAVAAAGNNKPVLNAEYNEYYLPGAPGEDTDSWYTLEQGAEGTTDRAMDNGYLTVYLPSMPDRLFLKLFWPLTSNTTYDLIVNTNEATAIPLPGPDDYAGRDFTWNWTDVYAKLKLTGTPTSSRNAAVSLASVNSMLLPGADVSADGNGNITAMFTLNEDAGTYVVTGIEKAVSRDYANSGKPLQSHVHEATGAAYEDVPISTGPDGTRTFSLAYDDMAFGVFLQIKTVGTASTNTTYKDYYEHAWLRIDTVPQILTLTDSATGATLTYTENTIPSDSEFSVSVNENTNYISDDMVSCYGILSGGKSAVYSVHLTSKGKNVTPIRAVSVNIPISSSLNKDKISIDRLSTTIYINEQDNPDIFDKEAGSISFDTKEVKVLYADYAVFEVGAPVDVGSEITERGLADGVYSADVLVLMALVNTFSMSSDVIANHKGYVVVDGGSPSLYLQLRPLSITEGSIEEGEDTSGYEFGNGYLSHVLHKTGADKERTEAEYLGYYDIFSTKGDMYPRYVKIPLTETNGYGYYDVGFIIPPMAYAERWTRFMLTNLTPTEENPLASYNKNAIIGAIRNADNAVSTVTLTKGGAFESREYNITETQHEALDAAIAEAQAVYDANPQTDAEIIAAVAALWAAVADLPKAELRVSIAAAVEYTETGFTADSWNAFRNALTTAQEVSANPAATQQDIDDAQSALAAAVAALTVVSDADKTALTALIGEAASITNIGYTPESWTALQTAIVNAQTLAGSSDPAIATQEAVNNAVTALQSAIGGLVRVIDTGGLDAAIADASATLAVGAAGYESKSFEALGAALAAAEAAKTGALTDADVTKQTAALTAAKAALVKTSELRVPLANGTYSLAGKTALWNYSQNQASMGNPAIDHARSYLTVENGTAKVHLFFRAMTFANMTGHLLEISNLTNIVIKDGILDKYDLVPATHHSYLAETDQFLPSGSVYPEEISINVTPGDRYTPVFVNVPVMGASANQPARVQIDWSGFDLGTPVDVSGLNAALASTTGVTADTYTAASYNSLAKSAEAGTALLSLNATQGQVDARTAAIVAAQAALMIRSADKTALNAAVAAADIVLNAGRGSKTADSWNAFVTALNSAKATALKTDATQSEADAALAALTAARAALADELPVTKVPEATAEVEITTPEIKTDSGSGASGEKVKIVESTVSAEVASQMTTKAAEVLNSAKTQASDKIAAGETVVAEVKIVTTLPVGTSVNEVKETVTNVSASAIKSILAESAKTENAGVELVLTVESDLAVVTLDSTELAALVQGKDDNAIISVAVVADARAAQTALPSAQANAVPSGKVPFAVELTVDNTVVTGTLASEIAITIPYVKTGGNDKKVVVYYVPADGNKIKYDAAYDNGRLTFVTDKI
jgi:hypothetical protein